jgi:cell division protein ZapA
LPEQDPSKISITATITTAENLFIKPSLSVYGSGYIQNYIIFFAAVQRKEKIRRKNLKNIFILLKLCCIIIVYQIKYGVNIMEKIRLMIAGEEYNLSTDDDLDYVAALGEELDKRISELMSGNTRISVTQAAIVTALEFADAAKKSEQTSENLRTQIQEYLEDAARARTDAEISKREAERLAKELASLKAGK